MEVFTIGHSTHSLEEFTAMLRSFEIEVLADVRSFPGSRHMPHFNRETLAPYIQSLGMEYIHMPEIGGRRREIPGIDPSLIGGWRHIAFRSYAAYTLTEEFARGLDALMAVSRRAKTCIMCAESVPWRCHRQIIADNLSFRGFTVKHIMDEDKTIPHTPGRFGAAAKWDGERVIYPEI